MDTYYRREGRMGIAHFDLKNITEGTSANQVTFLVENQRDDQVFGDNSLIRLTKEVIRQENPLTFEYVDEVDIVDTGWTVYGKWQAGITDTSLQERRKTLHRGTDEDP
jgi:hypothetical protein